MSAHHASGLAASIRNATESETFDLAGQSAATIEKLFQDAFAEPMSLSGTMIRLTFITGAGKLGRQKYDEAAAKTATSTLKDLGYEEDRGASAVIECAGSFKLQHDTGKNLKTVVVFPKIVSSAPPENELDPLSLQMHGGSGAMLQEGTPEHKLAFASAAIFKRMIETQCQTWSQKKSCTDTISQLQDSLRSMDEKLINGKALTDQEQQFYDSVSMTSLEEKIAQVRELMQEQVEVGKITSEERTVLLNLVKERIRKLEAEITDAKAISKTKRVENLLATKIKAEKRVAKLEKVTPRAPPPLKNEKEILKLRLELFPLEDIEAGAKGRLLTLKESQSVARKEEILEEITTLEEASRGWFESDEAFEARVKCLRSSWLEKKRSLMKKKGSVKSTPSGTTSSKWVTPGPRHVASKPTSKKSSGGGNLFAAMMDDSESD